MKQFHSQEGGFSLVELLIVLAITIIMSTVAVLAIRGTRTAYRTDDEALRIIDFMRDASQRALVQRQTMRLEIDKDDNVIRLIDENGAGTTDDKIFRQEQLEPTTTIRYTRSDATVGPPDSVVAPPSPSNYTAATFAQSTHPLSNNHSVCVIRFKTDGSATNVAGDSTSLTLYVWEPSATDSNKSKDLRLVRAITIFGGTGGVRFWKFNGTAFIKG